MRFGCSPSLRLNVAKIASIEDTIQDALQGGSNIKTPDDGVIQGFCRSVDLRRRKKNVETKTFDFISHLFKLSQASFLWAALHAQ